MPLRKINLPCGSMRESMRLKFACLDIKMETPLVLPSGFVARNADL